MPFEPPQLLLLAWKSAPKVSEMMRTPARGRAFEHLDTLITCCCRLPPAIIRKYLSHASLLMHRPTCASLLFVSPLAARAASSGSAALIVTFSSCNYYQRFVCLCMESYIMLLYRSPWSVCVFRSASGWSYETWMLRHDSRYILTSRYRNYNAAITKNEADYNVIYQDLDSR